VSQNYLCRRGPSLERALHVNSKTVSSFYETRMTRLSGGWHFRRCDPNYVRCRSTCHFPRLGLLCTAIPSCGCALRRRSRPCESVKAGNRRPVSRSRLIHALTPCFLFPFRCNLRWRMWQAESGMQFWSAFLRFLSHAHAATYNPRSSSKTQRTATGEFPHCLTPGGHSIRPKYTANSLLLITQSVERRT
jgi:hypothetical protein